MKLKNIFIFGAIAGSLALTSCHDLDIQPVNILTGEDIYNEAGITAYMAGLYSRLPMEDFATTTTSDFPTCEGYFGWNCITWDQVTTGETVNQNNVGMATAKLMNGYWACGYQLIRNANVLIQDLPAYIGTLQGAEEWIAEAKFIRAYTYFNMVHRYGGVPIVEEPQELTDNNEDLWVARNSHQESVDFILSDLDYAIENLGTTKVNGRANKYVAAAFKSRVALYAASIARYGQQFTHTVDGVEVCGIPESKAVDYYKQVYDAALIVEDGGYSLYRNDSDKAENFRKLFLDADKSSESIFIRQYDLNNQVHSFDYIYCPPRMTTSDGKLYASFVFTRNHKSGYSDPNLSDCCIWVSHTQYCGPEGDSNYTPGTTTITADMEGQEIELCTKEPIKYAMHYWVRIGARCNDTYKTYNYTTIEELEVTSSQIVSQ